MTLNVPAVFSERRVSQKRVLVLLNQWSLMIGLHSWRADQHANKFSQKVSMLPV